MIEITLNWFVYWPETFHNADGIQFFTKFSLTDDNQKNCNEARRELKKVVKYKVLNNLRNIRPFKKKLGGHKIPRKVSK